MLNAFDTVWIYLNVKTDSHQTPYTTACFKWFPLNSTQKSSLSPNTTPNPLWSLVSLLKNISPLTPDQSWSRDLSSVLFSVWVFPRSLSKVKWAALVWMSEADLEVHWVRTLDGRLNESPLHRWWSESAFTAISHSKASTQRDRHSLTKKLRCKFRTTKY